MSEPTLQVVFSLIPCTHLVLRPIWKGNSNIVDIEIFTFIC